MEILYCPELHIYRLRDGKKEVTVTEDKLLLSGVNPELLNYAKSNPNINVTLGAK